MANQTVCVLAKTHGCEHADDECCHLVTSWLLISE